MAPPKWIGWILLVMGVMGFGTSTLMLMGMARAKAPEEQGKSNLPPFEIVPLEDETIADNVDEGAWEYEHELRHPGFLVATVSSAKACKVTVLQDKDELMRYNIPSFSMDGKNIKCDDYCTEPDEKAADHLKRALLDTLTGICMLRPPQKSGRIEFASNISISIVDLTDIPPKKEPIDYPLAITGMAVAFVLLGSGGGYLKWWMDKFG